MIPPRKRPFPNDAAKLAAHAALLELTREAIVLIDDQGIALTWNHAAEEMFGVRADKAIGRSIVKMNIVSQEKFAEISAELKMSKRWSGEISFEKSENVEAVAESRWQLIPRQADQPEIILFICSDIAEKRRALLQSYRTKRMGNLGSLAGGIAHDLNNVLTPIMMCVELLRIGETDIERLDTLETIDRCARRGAEMVAQVLVFAKASEGSEASEGSDPAKGARKEVKTEQLLKEVNKLAADTFPKSILINVEVPADIWSVLGDSTQLYQVLINISVNARDSMPKGGTLAICAANMIISAEDLEVTDAATPGAYVLISVEDSGTGMTEEIVDRIFEPFFTTKEFGKGTGLGLSTSLAIVKSHGGFIRVQSEAGSESGQGTRVSIFLPARWWIIDSSCEP